MFGKKQIGGFVCGVCALAVGVLALDVPLSAARIGELPIDQNNSHSVSVIPNAIAFPQVPPGTRYSQAIRLVNESDSLKTVDAITANGSGLRLERFFGPVVLGAGESIAVTLDYEPTGSSGALGKVTVFVKGEAPSEIEVQGAATQGGGELAVEGNLDFGNVPVGGVAKKSMTLTNTGKTDMQIGNPMFSDSSFSILQNSAVRLAPGQGVALEVEFKPRTPGARRADAIVGSGEKGPIRIAVSGEGVDASEHKIALNWQGSEVPVQGYYVYRSTDTRGPFARLNESPVIGPEYTDEAVAAGVEYFYVVTSVDSDGTESPFSEPMAVRAP